MLTFKAKFKNEDQGLRLFDAETEKGKYGNLVRVDFGSSICFYAVTLLGDKPTESERSSIIDEVEVMLNEQLHYWHDKKMLDCPTESEFETNNVYCFSLS